MAKSQVSGLNSVRVSGKYLHLSAHDPQPGMAALHMQHHRQLEGAEVTMEHPALKRSCSYRPATPSTALGGWLVRVGGGQ